MSLTGILIIALIIFIICFIGSVWTFGLIGYLCSLGFLLIAFLVGLYLSFTKVAGVNAEGLYLSATFFLFFFYLMTTQYLMKRRFAKMEEFRDYLVSTGKFCLPYSILYYIPHIIALIMCIYVFAILIPKYIH